MKRAILILTLLAGAVVQAGTYLPPAKYATQYTLYFDTYDSNSPWRNYETAPAAADMYVYQDGASGARATNSATDIGRTFSLVLTAGEMTAAVVTVDINDASDPPLYGDTTFYIPTYGNASAYMEINLDEDIVDAVLDEALNGGNHRTKHSVADYIRRAATSGGAGDGEELVLEDGTAQAGTINTITLAADALDGGIDGKFATMPISITDGTAVGDSRVILSYNGTTNVATVDRNFSTAPDATSVYQITGSVGSIWSDSGTAQAGGASTITLASTASADDDVYNGAFVVTLSGTGSSPSQTRLISDYVGSTKVATVSAAWGTQPDSTTVYAIVPGGEKGGDSVYNDYITHYAYSTDVNETYIYNTYADVNSGTVTVDANDLMTAVYTDYTATPNTLGWLWYHTFTDLP
jgi:hypothetical protein